LTKAAASGTVWEGQYFLFAGKSSERLILQSVTGGRAFIFVRKTRSVWTITPAVPYV